MAWATYFVNVRNGGSPTTALLSLRQTPVLVEWLENQDLFDPDSVFEHLTIFAEAMENNIEEEESAIETGG